VVLSALNHNLLRVNGLAQYVNARWRSDKMPTTLLNQANLTASTKTANILSGDINEFVPYDAIINIYAVSSAAGVRMTILADSDVLVDDKEIITIGATLIDKDHAIDSFEISAGTRMAVFLRETAASGTTDVLFKMEVLPA
jgi:metal-dependent HD superfamily phosphatase/phosphodiesterase